ncbi:MAG: AraC family transcriptional regulator [Clostridia bacterium]|nr:AraC family transcriptional regulator [Clostridia bacterium]
MRFDELILYDDRNIPYIKTFHSTVSPIKRSYNAHHHTECELSVFIDGEGVYSVCGKEYEFKPMDVFLFGSNEEHCITAIDKEINLLNMQFEPRILWEHSENIELLKLFSAWNEHFSNRFNGSDTTLSRLIISIENELRNKDIGYKIQVKYLLFAALIHMMRNYPYTQKDTAFVGGETTEQLKNAMLYIDSNLETRLTLKDIADAACMTQTYFSSVFKKFNGISPWEYITIKRVEMAINLLKTSDMSKLEIAEHCGFSSSSNFYKAFFKITGKHPKDFCR